MTWIKDTGSSGPTNYIWNKDSPSPANGDVWLEYDAGDDFLTLNCRQARVVRTFTTGTGSAQELRVVNMSNVWRRRTLGRRPEARGHRRSSRA